jgi:hypothetical protein
MAALPTAAPRAGGQGTVVLVAVMVALVGAVAFSSHFARAARASGARHGTAGQAPTATRVPVGHGEHGRARPHTLLCAPRTHKCQALCASIHPPGRPAGRANRGRALHVSPFLSWGTDSFKSPEAARGPCQYTDHWAPYDPWIWAARSIRLYCV